MWHEARKQEKALRGVMVNFQKRAERRREFYDKMRSNPMKFLRLFGQPMKIHTDPAIAAAGDSPSTMSDALAGRSQHPYLKI
jgi:arginine/serine-rich splicing factor 16